MQHGQRLTSTGDQSFKQAAKKVSLNIFTASDGSLGDEVDGFDRRRAPPAPAPRALTVRRRGVAAVQLDRDHRRLRPARRRGGRRLPLDRCAGRGRTARDC